MSARWGNQIGVTRELVAETGRDGNLVTALGAAAAQDLGATLGGHAAQKAMDLATTAAVGLEGALRHCRSPLACIVRQCLAVQICLSAKRAAFGSG